MSNQEEMAAIGSMVTERAATKRQLAIRLHEIQKVAEKLRCLEASLREPRDFCTALEFIKEFADTSELESLRTAVADYQRLNAQLRALNEKLQQAGME